MFQNYKNIPQFETSFKTFYFPFENPAASPSLDRNEPPQEKHPTLNVTLDCGYESSQGVWGAVLPQKEPIWLPLRDSAKFSSVENHGGDPSGLCRNGGEQWAGRARARRGPRRTAGRPAGPKRARADPAGKACDRGLVQLAKFDERAIKKLYVASVLRLGSP